jgi:hypothetical protein
MTIPTGDTVQCRAATILASQRSVGASSNTGSGVFLGTGNVLCKLIIQYGENCFASTAVHSGGSGATCDCSYGQWDVVPVSGCDTRQAWQISAERSDSLSMRCGADAYLVTCATNRSRSNCRLNLPNPGPRNSTAGKAQSVTRGDGFCRRST